MKIYTVIAYMNEENGHYLRYLVGTFTSRAMAEKAINAYIETWQDDWQIDREDDFDIFEMTLDKIDNLADTEIW